MEARGEMEKMENQKDQPISNPPTRPCPSMIQPPPLVYYYSKSQSSMRPSNCTRSALVIYEAKQLHTLSISHL